MPNRTFDDRSYMGDDDDGAPSKQDKKRYEVAISTQNLRWKHLARYLNLEFKTQKFKVDEDQKVTILNDEYIVMLPSRLKDEQKQDIDSILRSNDEHEINEFFEALEEDVKQKLRSLAEEE